MAAAVFMAAVFYVCQAIGECLLLAASCLMVVIDQNYGVRGN
jgi:hypothetical protein